MTTTFDTALNGYRYVLTNRGDSLQRLALRELGDASLWTTIRAINNLQPPYLTDDASAASDYVILNGADYLIVPATTASSTKADPTTVYGTDLLLDSNGRLSLSGNDFAVVSGVANLKQALTNAIQTEQGELLYHPTYGSLVRRILGAVIGPTKTLLAAEYAKAPVAADPRISSITSATATATGTAISVSVEAETIDGTDTSVSTDI